MSAASASLTSSLPKWQIAIAVGAPVALGIGVYVFFKSKNKDVTDGMDSTSKDNSQRTEPTEIIKSAADQALCEKNKGNKYFKAGRYLEAIRHYSTAIDLCPADNINDLATYHQNRAAAYEMLGKPADCRADCDIAVTLKPRYTKALLRRARACESLTLLQPCLQDVTAVCILDGFQNQPAMLMADRVLRQLGQQRAAERKRDAVMPSRQMVNAFINSFQQDPVMLYIGNTTATEQLQNGHHNSVWGCVVRAVRGGELEDVVPACTALLQDTDVAEGAVERLHATLLRGTFHLLSGSAEQALLDFTTVVEHTEATKQMRVNALIKRGSCHLNQDPTDKRNLQKFSDDFDRAVEIDENNCDIYFHRGQIRLVSGDVDDARADFDRVIRLNDDSPLAWAQKTHTDFRVALTSKNNLLISESIGRFKALIVRFPRCIELRVLYAQALTEMEKYDEADQQFALAIETDPTQAAIYVNRGHLLLQWKGDMDKAAVLMEKAIELDSRCELAHESLGMIQVQRGNLSAGVDLFDRGLDLTNKMEDLQRLYSLREAAAAQLHVAQSLGVSCPTP